MRDQKEDDLEYWQQQNPEETLSSKYENSPEPNQKNKKKKKKSNPATSSESLATKTMKKGLSGLSGLGSMIDLVGVTLWNYPEI